jgi:hypothetical protein
VYVGKIAPTLDDEIVSKLLKACGGVKSWKRQEDPETKELKGFGFCEFEDAEGVLRGIRLLNGLKMDGQELLLKGNTATQKYIAEYEENKVRCMHVCMHAWRLRGRAAGGGAHASIYLLSPPCHPHRPGRRRRARRNA